MSLMGTKPYKQDQNKTPLYLAVKVSLGLHSKNYEKIIYLQFVLFTRFIKFEVYNDRI